MRHPVSPPRAGPWWTLGAPPPSRGRRQKAGEAPPGDRTGGASLPSGTRRPCALASDPAPPSLAWGWSEVQTPGWEGASAGPGWGLEVSGSARWRGVGGRRGTGEQGGRRPGVRWERKGIEVLRPQVSSHLTRTPPWEANEEGWCFHFIDEKTEVQRGAASPQAAQRGGGSGVRGYPWEWGWLGCEEFIRGRVHSEQGGPLRSRAAPPLPIARVFRPLPPTPPPSSPGQASGGPGQACRAPGAEARVGAHSPALLSFSLKFHTPWAFGRSPERFLRTICLSCAFA